MNKYSLSALFILALLITQSAAISSENVPSLQGTSDASSDRELLEEVHAEIESFANESDVVNVRELKIVGYNQRSCPKGTYGVWRQYDYKNKGACGCERLNNPCRTDMGKNGFHCVPRSSCGNQPVKPVVNYIETCTGTNCQGYRGTQTKTNHGRTCQAWGTNNPHIQHKAIKSLIKYKKYGLDENYCRNPSMAGTTIWCYTTDQNMLWDYCKPKSSEQIKEEEAKARKAAAAYNRIIIKWRNCRLSCPRSCIARTRRSGSWRI